MEFSLPPATWSNEQQCVHARVLRHVRLFMAPWTVAHQAPLTIGFPRQEYWDGLPFSPLRDPPDPGIEPTSPVSHVPPALAADSLPLCYLGSPKQPKTKHQIVCKTLGTWQ